jgi:hypothetical protein
VGILFYGTSRLPIPFDDRGLAHLQVVMIAKFRRHEGFTLSWVEADNSGARSTIWVSPTCELHFQYFGSRSPAINRHWLEQLAALANTSSGLRLTEETEVPVPEPAL